MSERYQITITFFYSMQQQQIETNKNVNPDNEQDNTINHLKTTLRVLNSRQLPTWDHNKKKRDSIKEHLQRAKELGRRMQWSDKE